MEKEIAELKKYLEAVVSFTLPSYKELPGVDLYMEQVLEYINRTLDSLTLDQENMLTSFMVNNYVKAKMIDLPVKKKYSKDQIGYLMAICLMKSTISMADMSLLLELDSCVSVDKGRLYAFWASMESSILQDTAKKTLDRVGNFAKTYDSKKGKDEDGASQDMRASLGLIALRLAIQAQANKLISDSIIAALRSDMHGDQKKEKAVQAEQKEENHRAERDAKKEASRLAAEKEAKEKKKKRTANSKGDKK